MGGPNRYYVILRLSTQEYYVGRLAPPVLRGGRTTHVFSPDLKKAVRYRQHPLRVLMPRLLRTFWRDLRALDAGTLQPFERWRVRKAGHLTQAPPPVAPLTKGGGKWNP